MKSNTRYVVESSVEGEYEDKFHGVFDVDLKGINSIARIVYANMYPMYEEIYADLPERISNALSVGAEWAMIEVTVHRGAMLNIPTKYTLKLIELSVYKRNKYEELHTKINEIFELE